MSTNQCETDQQHKRKMDRCKDSLKPTYKTRCPIIRNRRNMIKVSLRHCFLSQAKIKTSANTLSGEVEALCIAHMSGAGVAQCGELGKIF